jgi:Zn-dependent M32 family carboxypeptidase
MTVQEKEEYKKKIEAKLDDWETEIERMKSTIGKPRLEADRTLKKQLEAAEQNKKNLVTQFSRLKQTGEKAWEKTKTKVDFGLFKTSHAVALLSARVRNDVPGKSEK